MGGDGADGAAGGEEVLDAERVVVGIEAERLDPAGAGIGVEVDVLVGIGERLSLVPAATDRARAAKQRPGDGRAVRGRRAERQRERLAVLVIGGPARGGS
jgi:hypothetical protein